MVSVIITTHNRDIKMLKRAIDSVENQTFKDIEIIVVDDSIFSCSYQINNESLVKKYKKTKYFNTKGNEGACKARNIGIINAGGDYISFLDDDDFYYSNKIEKQFNILKESDDGVAFVFCSGYVHDETNNKTIVHGSEQCYLPVINFGDQLKKDRVCSVMPLIKKEALIKAGMFWEGLPARQDYEMWLRILKDNKALGIKDRLFQMNNHPGEQIHLNKKNEYIGLKMIFNKYKDYYDKDKVAKQRITKLISMHAPPIPKILYLIKSMLIKYSIK